MKPETIVAVLVLLTGAIAGCVDRQDYGTLGKKHYNEMDEIYVANLRTGALSAGESNLTRYHGDWCRQNALSEDTCKGKVSEFLSLHAKEAVRQTKAKRKLSSEQNRPDY